MSERNSYSGWWVLLAFIAMMQCSTNEGRMTTVCQRHNDTKWPCP